MGNTKLVSYGIQNEKSDLRAHVCVKIKKVYIYPTEAGIEAVFSGKHPLAPAYTGSIKTATGYLVPPGCISNCEVFKIPDKWWKRVNFKDFDNTTIKGEKAVRIVKNMIIKGMMPALKLKYEEVTEKDLQIEGTDIIIRSKAKIQVKCDYKGGEGGTGNLFLQTSECNPLKRF